MIRMEEIRSVMVNVSDSRLLVIAAGCAAILAVDILREKKISIRRILSTKPMIVRYLVYFAVFYAVILFSAAGEDLNVGFAYARF